MGVRDTTSTLLPPVALQGELAILGRATRVGEAGQSNSGTLVDPPGRAIQGLPACKATRSLWVRAPLELSGSRQGRGVPLAFPGGAAGLRQVRRRCSQVGICSKVRRLGSQRRARRASPPPTQGSRGRTFGPPAVWSGDKRLYTILPGMAVFLGYTAVSPDVRGRGLPVGPPAALPLVSLEPGCAQLPARMDLRSRGAVEPRSSWGGSDHAWLR